MQQRKTIARWLLGILLAGQFSWAGIALAEDHPSVSPTPAAQATVSPSPTAAPEPATTPDPTGTPEPTVAPEPTTSPAPTVNPSPTVSPTPTASPDPSGSSDNKSGKSDVSWSKTGVNGCVGIVPKWVYDTASSTWVLADQGSFTCDPKTGYYLSPKYVFDKNTAWYEILAPSAPLTDNFLTAPNVVHTVLGDLVVGSKDYQVAQALGLLSPTDGIVAANTGGAAGAAAVPVSTGNQSWFDFTNLVNVINNLQSNATSGNVAANKNTTVGDASSGAVSVLANLINLLASAWNWSNGNLNFFMQNLFGNTTGDLTLNPTETVQGGGGSLGVTANANGADSSNQIGLGDSSTLGINSSTGANIVNNVDATAKSGDVSANKNTAVGNLSSGQAIAEVNIINLINSFINSGSSFFGILNIFGNLNGDVLFPDGFLNGALASGTNVAANANGVGSGNQVNVNGGGSTTVNNNALNAINNNISTNAASGTVSGDSNTGVGAMTSGNAATANNTCNAVSSNSCNTTQGLFNLANSSVFGDNAVLVIVNVLGHWVGKIMTLPGAGGATQSALLTGNAQVTAKANGADSHNQVGINNGTDATVNNNSVGTITNNVNVKSQSGDVSATKNTSVGDMTSGDAKAASSVANIVNSVLNVKHWFGVLVINVFGDWLGDVGDNTAAGDAASPSLASATQTAKLAAAVTGPQTVVSNGQTGSGALGGGTVAGMQTGVTGTAAPASTLTAAVHQPTAAQQAAQAQNRDMTIMFLISAVMMLIAGALATMERRVKQAASR